MTGGQRNYKPKHKTSSVGREYNPRAAWVRLYDGDWEKYRVKFLDINPRCYACGERATVVDHLVPHQGDVVLFKKRDNHIPLCKSCHDTITAIHDRRYRPGNPIDRKLLWFANKRSLKDLSFRVKVLPTYP